MKLHFLIQEDIHVVVNAEDEANIFAPEEGFQYDYDGQDEAQKGS